MPIRPPPPSGNRRHQRRQKKVRGKEGRTFCQFANLAGDERCFPLLLMRADIEQMNDPVRSKAVSCEGVSILASSSAAVNKVPPSQEVQPLKKRTSFKIAPSCVVVGNGGDNSSVPIKKIHPVRGPVICEEEGVQIKESYACK